MPEKGSAVVAARNDSPHDKEAVCINTKKIYDACRDKDCLEDLRVFVTRGSQTVIDRAINVKCRQAELIWVFIDVESVSFNRGFYSVDVKYFYRITADAFSGVRMPVPVTGLATFDKRVILFGSEGNAKIFSSQTSLGGVDSQLMRRANMPVAVVEAVDPICLNVKLVESRECCCRNGESEGELFEVPECVGGCFDEELVLGGDEKRMLISLGQFSIIRLERDSQLVIPSFDFCMPEKECVGSSDDTPCDLFRRINFPVPKFQKYHQLQRPYAGAFLKIP